MVGCVYLKDDIDFPNEFSSYIHKKIGKNVSKIRKQKGVSQLKLAYAIGYKSVSPISSAEIYYNNIHFNVEQLVRIAYILKVPIEEFLKIYRLKVF